MSKPHPIDAYIGERLKQARLEASLRLIDAAEVLKVSHTQVDHYENGVNRVSWATLSKLAQLYSKKLPWFFEGAPGF